ncbi:MAG: hypothetical protein R2880_09750 [Deinococcales bacterium]
MAITPLLAGGKRSAAAAQGVNTNFVRIMNFTLGRRFNGLCRILINFSQFRSVR